MPRKRAGVHERWDKEGEERKKVCPASRTREVTGTTPNPRVVPMETSVAAYNEGERDVKEGKGIRGVGSWRQGSVGGSDGCVCARGGWQLYDGVVAELY